MPEQDSDLLSPLGRVKTPSFQLAASSMQPYSLMHERVQKRKPLGLSAPRTHGVVHEVSETSAEERCWNEATGVV